MKYSHSYKHRIREKLSTFFTLNASALWIWDHKSGFGALHSTLNPEYLRWPSKKMRVNNFGWIHLTILFNIESNRIATDELRKNGFKFISIQQNWLEEEQNVRSWTGVNWGKSIEIPKFLWIRISFSILFVWFLNWIPLFNSKDSDEIRINSMNFELNWIEFLTDSTFKLQIHSLFNRIMESNQLAELILAVPIFTETPRQCS